MKKIICLAAIILMFAGCEKEKSIETNDGSFVIHSTIKESATKVSLDDNEATAVETKWEIGDEVALQYVDNGVSSEVFKFTVEDYEDGNPKKAIMKSATPVDIPEGADIYAWYPYTTVPGTTVDIGAGQDGSLGTIHTKNLLATTTPTTFVPGQIIRLYFEHKTSIIKMTLGKSNSIDSVDPGVTIKGVNYAYSISVNTTDRTIDVTPSAGTYVNLPSYIVGSTTDPIYTLVAPEKTFGELDVAATGYAYDQLAHISVSVPMGLSFNNNKNTELQGGWTYLINQEMSFAQPGAADFKAYYFRSNDTVDEVIAHGNSKVYFLSDGRYHEMESVPGLAEACDILRVEGTANQYEVILNRDPEVRIRTYIKVPVEIITRYSSSLKRSVSFVALYNEPECTTQFRKEYDKASNEIVTTNNYYYLEAL